MKKVKSDIEVQTENDDMLDHYEFDYSKAKPNRFASILAEQDGNIKIKKEIILKEEQIASLIHFIRGEKIMLDSDLAYIYNVSTSRLNEQVKRNLKRFPPDFMFELTKEEFENLKSQNATSNWGGRRSLPKVFTEHGAIMLASVLNSQRAIDASISVVRAFVKLREFVLLSKEISKKLDEFESKTSNKFDEHDRKFNIVFETLKKILVQDSKPKNPMGFI